jgi:PST family polysaccharide transporter
MIIPLSTIPYLSRVLQPEEFGLVMYSQAFAAWITLIIEYGFNLSATREIARWRDVSCQTVTIVSGVQGAKLVLCVPLLFVSIIALCVVPFFQSHHSFLWASFGLAVVHGMSPLWFFQGIEKLTLPAALNIMSKIVAACAIFAMIKFPDDAINVLFIHLFTGLLVVCINTGIMYFHVRPSMPSKNKIIEALKMGWSMFLFRSSVSLYTTANAVILGFFVNPASVAFYAGAEKISKAALSMIGPISQAIFPRMSLLAKSNKKKADSLERIALFLIGGGGIIAGVCIFLLSPWIVNILLGDGYEKSVIILKILSLLLPIIAFSNVYGIQYMVPYGMDITFNKIIISAGMINILLAIFLANMWGGIGMAISVVLAELFVTTTMFFVVLKHKKKNHDTI